jgi:nicotinate-nucleotide adenylyltransferase
MPGAPLRPRIGVLGGTFDPVHRGHLDLARAAQAALALDQVWLVPSSVPPHRPVQLASAYHRFAMVALAVMAERNTSWLVASDIEVDDEGTSYTSATLGRLAAMGYDRSQIFFLSGADAFAEIATWRDYPGLLDRAHFVVVSRGGVRATTLRAALPELAGRMAEVTPATALTAEPSILLLDAATTDVSSTIVRDLLVRRRPLGNLVPAVVEQYALRHDLYRVAAPPAAAADHLHEEQQP